MPRDGAGTYTLPAGNPVISGTTIDVIWANPTMSDIAAALTDSLSRSGSGGMLVPFLNADGSIGAPGISWVNETTMGIYRPAMNEMRVAIAGVNKTRWVAGAANFLQMFVDAAWRNVLNDYSDITLQGRLVTDDSTLTRAGFNVPLGVAPTVPVEGDMWKTATNLFAHVGGVSQSLLGSNFVPASTQASSVLRGDGVGAWVEETSVTISASGNVTIDNSLNLSDTVDNLSLITIAGVTSVAGTGGYGYLDWGGIQTRFDEVLSQQFTIAGLASLFVPTNYGAYVVRDINPVRPYFKDDGSQIYQLQYVQPPLFVNANQDFQTGETAFGMIGNACYYDDGSNYTVTLEDNGSDNFVPKSSFDILNPGSGVITIAQGTGTQLFLMDGAGGAVTGPANVTLSVGGVCTVFRRSSQQWVVFGTGLA